MGDEFCDVDVHVCDLVFTQKNSNFISLIIEYKIISWRNFKCWLTAMLH